MNRPQRAFSVTLLLLTLGMFAITGNVAHASFIVDPDPDGESFYNGAAYKSVSSFTGYVKGENSNALVTVTTSVNVDTGAGEATIKPAEKKSILRSVTFTPASGSLFSEFSFRGQLLVAGWVTVVVQDNQGHDPQTFTFPNLKSNQNFDSIGIAAAVGSGETIKSVTILSEGFKEVKQVDFSFAPVYHPSPSPPVHTPIPATILLLGPGLIGLLGLKRRLFT